MWRDITQFLPGMDQRSPIRHGQTQGTWSSKTYAPDDNHPRRDVKFPARERPIHIRIGYQCNRLRLRGRRLAPSALVAGIGVALLLAVSGKAVAAGATSVVPPDGKIAGHGYSYWLQRSWQAVFSASAPANPCQSLTSDRRRVAYLTLKTIAPGADHSTCNEPAGRPMYVVQLSNECSTFKGDHGTFGTSDQQLRQCARAMFKGAKATTNIDGRFVNVDKLVAATDPYAVHTPKNNPYGIRPGTGRSAAYGFGLLITGFAKGTHTIHTLWRIATAKWNITFTVHVH